MTKKVCKSANHKIQSADFLYYWARRGK